MNIIIETLLPYLIPSLIGFLISLLVTELYGKDYTVLITVAGVLLISCTPLAIVLFFNSDFTIPFWQWLISWTPAFLAGSIVDLVMHPWFAKLLRGE